MLDQSVLDVLAGRSRYAAILGDGFALAAALDDGAVDLVIADPPFDAKTHAGVRTNKKGTNGKINVDFDVCAMAVKRLERAASAGVQMTIPARQPRAQQAKMFPTDAAKRAAAKGA